jgi:hypothetical protein
MYALVIIGNTLFEFEGLGVGFEVDYIPAILLHGEDFDNG